MKETPSSLRMDGQVNQSALKNNGDEMLPTRRSLLDRLKDWSDQESWRVFFDTYWKLIYHTGLKAGLTDAEAEDLVQETIIAVLKSMPRFEYRETGSFKKWLLQLTRWRIADQFRKRDRRVSSGMDSGDTSTGTAIMERLADPAGMALEAVWNEEFEANLMEVAVERVKQKVDSKQYQIFDLYVVKNWPVSRVAKTMGVNPGSVYLAKHRISRLIKQEIGDLRENPI